MKIIIIIKKTKSKKNPVSGYYYPSLKLELLVTCVSNVEKGSWIEQSEQMVKKCS